MQASATDLQIVLNVTKTTLYQYMGQDVSAALSASGAGSTIAAALRSLGYSVTGVVLSGVSVDTNQSTMDVFKNLLGTSNLYAIFGFLVACLVGATLLLFLLLLLVRYL